MQDLIFFIFSLKISLKDMDVYAWTFHWTCCRFSKSVVKLKKKKKKVNWNVVKKIFQDIFIFLFQNYDFAIFILKNYAGLGSH